MLNFWNLPKRLRPKIWPKEGQNVQNPKISTFQRRIRKIITKQPLFAKTKKKYFVCLFDGFFGLEDPQKPKNENNSNADT